MRTLIATLGLIALLGLANSAFAQPVLPNPDQAPIGGGAGLILAAGGAYAIKKIREKRRNSEQDPSDL